MSRTESVIITVILVVASLCNVVLCIAVAQIIWKNWSGT